jgi:hypothetical protein
VNALRTQISLAAERARAAQVEQLAQARELARRFALAQGVGASAVAAGMAQAMPDGGQQIRAWEMATQARYLADVQRLQQSGEDESQAAAVLFTASLDTTGRASSYRKSGNDLSLAGAMALWGVVGATLGAIYGAWQQQSSVTYWKQAIAAIDERTTDCCLRVHGQVQPLDKPFELSGTPRFADKVQNPPFHLYCRTATALYRPEMEQTGLSTAEMISAARSELAARAITGKRVEIHPASAISRR